MIDKALAAVVTISFMAVVQPDPDASKVGIAFVGIMMYEALTWCIKYIRQSRKKNRYIKSTTISRQDIKRWSNEWIKWPIKEVS